MAKESGSGSGAKRKTPGRRNGVAAWLADQRNVFLFVGIVVVVLGGSIVALTAPTIFDDDEPEAARLEEVDLIEMRDVHFDDTTNFIYMDVKFDSDEAPSLQVGPRIACVADDDSGNSAQGQVSSWGNLEEDRLVRKSVPMADVPDGRYTVTCTSGETSLSADVDVEHNWDNVVDAVYRGRYRIPTMLVSAEAPPVPTEDIFSDVTFTFYRSGKLDRQLEGQNEPTTFFRQDDGTYVGTSGAVGDIESQEIRLTFLGEDEVLTRVTVHTIAGNTYDYEVTWSRVLGDPLVIPTSTPPPSA